MYNRLYFISAGRLHLQHAAAWLQKCLLRLRLPDLPHPLLGAAGQSVRSECMYLSNRLLHL